MTSTTRRVVWMSDEFLDFVYELGSNYPRIPGANAVMQYHILDAPGGTVSFYDDIHDGQMVRIARGVAEHPDFEVTVPYAEYKLMFKELRGTETISSRKVTGDLDKLEQFKKVHEMPEFRHMREMVRDHVVWPDDPEALELEAGE